jgi:hypothetical protein
MSETDPYYAGPAISVAKFDTSNPKYSGDTGAPAVAPVVVPEQPVEADQTDELTVPEGSIKNVLAWVGDDRTKAQAALDAENAASEPRTTLVTKLEDIISA